MVEMEMDVKSKRKMNLGENREKRRKEPDERLRESMVPCHCRRCYDIVLNSYFETKLWRYMQMDSKEGKVKNVGKAKVVEPGKNVGKDKVLETVKNVGKTKVVETPKNVGKPKVVDPGKFDGNAKLIEHSKSAVVEKSNYVELDTDVDNEVEMQLPFDPVKDVTKKKEVWRLGVFLEDLWTVYKGDVEDHMELLIRDIKGDTIQAMIMQTDIATWKPRLCEGKTYNMRNFRVAENDASYKMSPHKYRLQFVGATRVAEENIRGMPITAFNFKDFTEIQDGKYRADLLVDAIGVINSVGKFVTATQTKKGSVAFSIKDLRDNVMDCTLWDALSVEFINFYNSQSDVGRIVLILKHARVKEPQGSYPLQLTNVWNGTKLLFDDKIPEIQAFIQSLPKDVVYMSQNKEASNSTAYYTQSTHATQFNTDENFLKHARVISLADMKKLKQDTFCVTVVTTSHIRKGHKIDVPNIKYKLDVEVYDGHETTKFVFWDNTLEELIGMNAATLLEKEKKKGLGDPQDYPQIMNSIMERVFAFRVKWTPGWGGQASVSFCKDSKELVAKIQQQLPVGQSIIKENDARMEEVEEEVEEDVEEAPEVITESPQPQKFTKEDIDKFASLDEAILSTPNASVSAENDFSASSHKTPGKRGAAKNLPIETVGMETQLSSSRGRKLIKKEKI
ncbi:hypothetical protein P8452_63017 [Trifolium repens]|nr:hypothetical protein P8452_63017 [Trifolium repens]